MDVPSDVQFRGHLEGEAKLASKKLAVFGRARQDFSPAQRPNLNKV